jgi:hypothetical protein
MQTTPRDSGRLELELLHQFTISTAYTLATENEIRDMWRILVPQVGFSTDYIMEGIFALAAVHMARYNADRRDLLLSHAAEYHTASLAKALPLLSAVTPQNCSHLFLFGVLTLFYSLARPRQAGDMLLVGNGIVPEWLYLFRGMYPLREADSSIHQSPVALIFQTTEPSYDFWVSHSPEENEALAELERKLRSNSMHDPIKLKALGGAIDGLKRSFTFLYGYKDVHFKDEDRFRGFYTWIFEIDREYLKLLKDTDSEALCVLAFYTVLLKDLDKYWWMEGWAVHILQRIYTLLDGTYRLWIRWPIEQVGWVPDRVVL